MFNFHWLMVSLTPSLLIIDGDEEFCHSTEKLLSPEYKSKKPTKKKSSKNQKKKVNCCNTIEESIKIFNTFSIDLILINYLMKKDKKFIDLLKLISLKNFPVISKKKKILKK